MNVQSVNSVNQVYLQTTVAQQKVATDRANVIESETELSQNQAQLDQDLTYLATLQRKSHRVQQTEMGQAQAAALNRLNQQAQAAQSQSFESNPREAKGTRLDVRA
jgi:phage gp16-like protein